MRRFLICTACMVALPSCASTGGMSRSAIDAEVARLDFKVGSWTVAAKIRNSPDGYLEGAGTLDIRWDESGTLIADMDIAFDAFKVVGTTTRRFDPSSDRWAIAWLPVDGPPVPDIEGQFHDGRFIEINHGVDARGPYIGRLIIYDMSRDHFSVRKDHLYDDGAVAREVWVYEATRIHVSGGR
jgi:hypothetical protein